MKNILLILVVSIMFTFETNTLLSQSTLSDENVSAIIRSLKNDPFYDYQSSSTAGINGLINIIDKSFQYSDNSELNMAYIKYLSGRLAVLGFNAGNIQSLRNSGIDVIDAATSFPTNVTQRTILAEYVLRGKIKSIENDLSLDDGFNTSIEIEPIVVYKQKSNLKSVYLRIKTGYNRSGNYEYLSSDIDSQVGDEFILFLSTSFYNVLTNNKGKSNKSYFVEIDGGFELYGGKYIATLPGSDASYELSNLEDLIQVGIK